MVETASAEGIVVFDGVRFGGFRAKVFGVDGADGLCSVS